MKGFQHYEEDELWYSQNVERPIPTDPNINLSMLTRGGRLPTLDQLNIENRIPSLHNREMQNDRVQQSNGNLPHVEMVNLPDAVLSTDLSQKSMEHYKTLLQNEQQPATFECQQFYPVQQFYSYPFYPNYYYQSNFQQQPIINAYVPPPNMPQHNLYQEEDWRQQPEEKELEEKEEQPPQVNNQIIELHFGNEEEKEEKRPVKVTQKNKTSTRDCTIKNIPTVIDVDKEENLMSETSYIDLTSENRMMTSSTTVSEDTITRFRIHPSGSETVSEVSVPTQSRRRRSNRKISMSYDVTMESRLKKEYRKCMYDCIILSPELIEELSKLDRVNMKQYLNIRVAEDQLRMHIIYQGKTYKTLYTLKLVNGKYLRSSLRITERKNTPQIGKLAQFFDDLIPKQFDWLFNNEHVRHLLEARQKSVFEY